MNHQSRLGRAMLPHKPHVISAIHLVAFIAVLTTYSTAQKMQSVSSNPDRNFIGSWIGAILVNPTHEPSPVHLTITEKPDGSGMLWEYEFGIKGQQGYKTASKTMLLRPAEALLLLQWQGEPQRPFRTLGLEDLAHEGYGKLTASEINSGKRWFFSKHYTNQITFELRPDTMIYLWEEVTDNGRAKVYSHFSFHREAPAN